MGTCEGRVGLLCLISPVCDEMAATELYTPQRAEMGSGVIYAPDEQGVIMLSAVIPRVTAL